MGKAVIEMGPRVDGKPPHPSANEMARRMKRFEKEFRRMAQAQAMNAEASKRRFSNDGRECRASRWTLWERRLGILFRDLNRLIDFWLARYIVWRETRRDRNTGRKS